MQIAESTRALFGFAAYRGRLAAVRRQRDYRSFWIGSSLQGLGQGTQFMVIGWLVLLVTDSSTQLGLVIFLYGAPNVALLLVAGVLADRIDRRYILMATQVIVGGVIAALAFTWWPSGTSMPLPSSWAWYSR